MSELLSTCVVIKSAYSKINAGLTRVSRKVFFARSLKLRVFFIESDYTKIYTLNKLHDKMWVTHLL